MKDDGEAAAAAYYATKGIRPADFLQFPKSEKMLMIAAMEQALERDNNRLITIGKMLGAKFK